MCVRKRHNKLNKHANANKTQRAPVMIDGRSMQASKHARKQAARFQLHLICGSIARRFTPFAWTRHLMWAAPDAAEVAATTAWRGRVTCRRGCSARRGGSRFRLQAWTRAREEGRSRRGNFDVGARHICMAPDCYSEDKTCTCRENDDDDDDSVTLAKSDVRLSCERTKRGGRKSSTFSAKANNSKRFGFSLQGRSRKLGKLVAWRLQQVCKAKEFSSKRRQAP